MDVSGTFFSPVVVTTWLVYESLLTSTFIEDSSADEPSAFCVQAVRKMATHNTIAIANIFFIMLLPIEHNGVAITLHIADTRGWALKRYFKKNAVKLPNTKLNASHKLTNVFFRALPAWWAIQDSNLEPTGYEPGALTIELMAHAVQKSAETQRCPRKSVQEAL